MISVSGGAQDSNVVWEANCYPDPNSLKSTFTDTRTNPEGFGISGQQYGLLFTFSTFILETIFSAETELENAGYQNPAAAA